MDYNKLSREEFNKMMFERFILLRMEQTPSGRKQTCFPISTGQGWNNLVWKLCEDIEEEIVKSELEGVEMHDCKEKFGQLRLYLSCGNEKIFAMIDKAEDKSYEICEMCGAPGTPNDKGWITTLCKKCRAEE